MNPYPLAVARTKAKPILEEHQTRGLTVGCCLSPYTRVIGHAEGGKTNRITKPKTLAATLSIQEGMAEGSELSVLLFIFFFCVCPKT